MAQVNVDYESAFKNIGADFSIPKEKGLKVMVTTQGLKFVIDNESLASAPVPPAKIAELANKFDPANQSHQALKATFCKIAKDLAEKLSDGGKPMKTSPAPKPASAPKEALPTTAGFDMKVFPKDQMKTAVCVPLAKANELFQPVNGTSAGSRYYVVGMGPGIKVAARVQNKSMSVRIEGPDYPKLQAKIIDAGVFGPQFAGKLHDSYASMHVEVEGKVGAQRVVGAVLGAMAPYISHPTLDLQPLVDAA